MASLAEFLEEVQLRSGLDPIRLVRTWTDHEVLAVGQVIARASARCGFIGSLIGDYFSKHSNQARGNLAAEHFRKVVAPALQQGWSLEPAPGAGYPDMILSEPDGQRYCLETKATSDWRDVDGNRRVLCSSPSKLRALVGTRALSAPPAHLLCTILYDRVSSRIEDLMLHFLAPDEEVNVRLEASTSQKLLSQPGRATFRLSNHTVQDGCEKQRLSVAWRQPGEVLSWDVQIRRRLGRSTPPQSMRR